MERKVWAILNTPSSIFSLSPQPTASMLLQVFTYHLSHRNLPHLVKNVLILTSLGNELEFKLGTMLFLRYCLTSLLFGGVVGSLLEATVQGTSGLVLSFLILKIFYFCSNGQKTKKLPKALSFFFLSVCSIFYLISLFYEYDNVVFVKTPKKNPEIGSEYAHMMTAFTGGFLCPYLFGIRREKKEYKKLNSILKIANLELKKEKEQKKEVGLFKRMKKFVAGTDSEGEGSSGEEYSDDGVYFEKGRRKLKRRNNADLYENIPDSKLKPSQRFHRRNRARRTRNESQES
eukprot:maker-scaffold_1-snap-gene-25.6-mRNA-1 protein AED:0.07 eAED:0.10 QI:0/0/0.5/1/1/1/2/151/287